MNIMEKVKKHGVLLDGGMGSMLIAKGMKGGESAEMWNIDHPELVQEVHQAYFYAGADVATSNTFGASAFKLEKTGIQKSSEEINRAALNIAKRAAGPGQYVAGDICPLGEMLSPMGTMTMDQAEAIFRQHAGVIETEGVDFFIIETMFDLNEALAAIKAIQAVSSKSIFCSLTFQKTKKGFFTLVGNSVAQSMKTLRDAGAAAVGANCSIGSDTMVELAREIRENVEIPVIIQPNAGLPQTGVDGTITYPENEIFFAKNIQKIKALGVEIVGGCCGTTPAFIRKIKETIQ